MDTSIIIAFLGIVSSIVGFIFGRRKRHVEVVGPELSNMQQAIQVWKEVAEYQTGEISTLRNEINELKRQLSGVERLFRHQTTRELTKIVSLLKEENTNQFQMFGEKLTNFELQISKNQ
jgi:hypothetical protein